MTLLDIDIVDFKNIAGATLEFSPGVNCLLGRNGMGKSNLLEAIHMLCLARGFSSMPDQSYIRHGAESALVKGTFEADASDRHTISCGIVRSRGKTLKTDGKTYQRMSDHIGLYPAVTVAPHDSRLVSESGEERRRFMDVVISQARPDYLSHLIGYNRALESRNRMLRAGLNDPILYEAVEAAMDSHAVAIHAARAEWVGGMAVPVARYYSEIAGGGEQTSISYKSALNSQTMAEVLAANRAKDQVLGYTSGGPHRDDILMNLDSYSLRRLGSQGQVKTFTIALRLAVYDFLRQTSGRTPLLLLDDIFDKLDTDRVGRIMQIVSGGGFGQIFITDTNRKHLDEILASIGGCHSLLEVSHGTFTPLR